MQVRFRRTSDSVAYACIWWAAFLFSNAGLIFYGYTKVNDILTGDFFLQTTELPRSHFHNEMSFPDILMCSTGTKVLHISSFNDVAGKNMTTHNINVTSAILPIYHDLCNTHEWLTIFSTQERLVNVTQNEDGIFCGAGSLGSSLCQTVVNVETYALRSDFWGYFGSLHKVPQRSVQTESTSTYYSGPTKIQIFFPKKEISQKQIL
ncbi:hypothetical protein CPB97_002052 [Podila verticillata]|nr:hypothetical protein CPB97_002052 [Podila verticillata]